MRRILRPLTTTALLALLTIGLASPAQANGIIGMALDVLGGTGGLVGGVVGIAI
ncbi:hypothetical protein [Streptomyces sp. C36]|uniref:hypothetical protein n=1 Tax=Streptomyces sp. C36 TaxID=3237122 RepID=UPI0034C68D3F